MRKLLITGIILVSISLVYTIDKYQSIKNVNRLVNIEYRVVKASSEVWILKTKLEYPEFPPRICVKSTNKMSMKRLTKNK